MSFVPLVPMEPVLTDKPFDNPDYLYQVKWDGVRMLAVQEETGILLYNRKGRMKARIYPEVCAEISDLKLARGTILDGEMVSFGDSGRPDFRRVLRRDLSKTPKPQIEICYVVFDYLLPGEIDLTRQTSRLVVRTPLEERLAQLRWHVKATTHVQVTDDFESGTALFDRMSALEMEGIVAKRRDSFYYFGQKHSAWQKVKCWRFIDARAASVKMRDGRPASLVVADGEEIIGHVSSGLAATDWRAIMQYAQVSARPGLQSENVPLNRGIQVTIRFIEWTHQGQLRSPVVESLSFP